MELRKAGTEAVRLPRRAVGTANERDKTRIREKARRSDNSEIGIEQEVSAGNGKLTKAEPIFRALQPDELEQSYQLYQDVCDWLRKNSIQLWLSPLPLQKFQQRQQHGELFGLFTDNELAVILTISSETVQHWQNEIGTGPQWWLGTIATAPRFRGQILGELAVAKAVKWLRAKDASAVYLDCAQGFLVNFYERCGFVPLASKEVTLISGNAYPLVLMRRLIALP